MVQQDKKLTNPLLFMTAFIHQVILSATWFIALYSLITESKFTLINRQVLLHWLLEHKRRFSAESIRQVEC